MPMFRKDRRWMSIKAIYKKSEASCFIPQYFCTIKQSFLICSIRKDNSSDFCGIRILENNCTFILSPYISYNKFKMCFKRYFLTIVNCWSRSYMRDSIERFLFEKNLWYIHSRLRQIRVHFNFQICRWQTYQFSNSPPMDYNSTRFVKRKYHF